MQTYYVRVDKSDFDGLSKPWGFMEVNASDAVEALDLMRQYGIAQIDQYADWHDEDEDLDYDLTSLEIGVVLTESQYRSELDFIQELLDDEYQHDLKRAGLDSQSWSWK